MIFKIYRYQPVENKVDIGVYFDTYEVDRADIPGMMLLHALEYLKIKDPSLSFRRSCGAGVCGSDGMNINGVNGLACLTPLNSLPDEVVLRPLPGMPVLRDLVVDLSNFYQQYKRIRPYVVNHEQRPQMSIEQAESLEGLLDCILCACCSSMCPSYWWNSDKFVGPAGLLWACRFVLDSRDMSQLERLTELNDLYSLYRCRSIMNCVEVCPKDLNPNAAIKKLRNLIGTL